MQEDHYASPIAVASVADCTFYHSYDLPKSGCVRGHWDLRGRFDEYVCGAQVAGKRVLDVGTASGFLSFEAERRGADVVSFDAATADYWDRLPFPVHRDPGSRASWLVGAEDYLLCWKRSYWLVHRELQSKNKVVYGNVYNIPPEIGMFDAIMVGQILVHLRDAIGALSSIAARCAKTIIVAEGMISDEKPYSAFLGRAANPNNDFSFWHHSTGFYIELMQIMGFALCDRCTGAYICNIAGPSPKDVEITTLVFERG